MQMPNLYPSDTLIMASGSVPKTQAIKVSVRATDNGTLMAIAIAILRNNWPLPSALRAILAVPAQPHGCCPRMDDVTGIHSR